MRTQNQHEPEPIYDDDYTPYPAIMRRDELVAVVVMERCDLYNNSQPCGAEALQHRLRSKGVQNVPSISTISRIIATQGLVRFGRCVGMD